MALNLQYRLWVRCFITSFQYIVEYISRYWDKILEISLLKVLESQILNSNPSSQKSEWLGDQSNSKIKESREELGKKLHLSHQNDERFQWIIVDKKWNPLAYWKCKRWNEIMVPIWRRTTVADWRIARSVTIRTGKMLLRKLLHNLTGERSRLLVTIHFTLHRMQSHVTWQIWCMNHRLTS